MLSPFICIGKDGKGMGRVMSSTAGYRIKHSRKLPCIDFTSWKRGWNKAFADILFFSSHNLLKCGRVHCDSQHSRIFPTIIHVLYIAAVRWEDYKETTGKEGEFKLFAQVNEQCSWGTSFFSPLSLLPNEPVKGSLKGVEAGQCVLCLSDVCSSLVPELLLTVLLFKFYIPFDGLSDVSILPVACPLL